MPRILAGLAILITLLTGGVANAGSVQLGRPDSLYAVHNGRTYYGPGSGASGEICNLGDYHCYRRQGQRANRGQVYGEQRSGRRLVYVGTREVYRGPRHYRGERAYGRRGQQHHHVEREVLEPHYVPGPSRATYVAPYEVVTIKGTDISVALVPYR